MTTGQILSIFRDAIFTVMKVGGPILIVAMLVGLIISVFQAATQIHEQTITFVPKLLAVVAVLLLLGSWMSTQMTDFTERLLSSIVSYV